MPYLERRAARWWAGSALQALQRAAALKPDDAKTLIALARAHATLGWRGIAGPECVPELQRADAYLQRARKLAPEDAEALAVEGAVRSIYAVRLAVAKRDAAEVTAELTRARIAFREAIKRDGEMAEAYAGLGMTYLTQDNGSQEAVVALEAAAYLLPLDTEIARAMADLHLRRGSPLQAIGPLEHILRWTHSEETQAWARKRLNDLRNEAAPSSPASAVSKDSEATGE